MSGWKESLQARQPSKLCPSCGLNEIAGTCHERKLKGNAARSGVVKSNLKPGIEAQSVGESSNLRGDDALAGFMREETLAVIDCARLVTKAEFHVTGDAVLEQAGLNARTRFITATRGG